MVYFKFVKQQKLIKLYYYPSKISVSQRNLEYLNILESEYINSLLEQFRSRMMSQLRQRGFRNDLVEYSVDYKRNTVLLSKSLWV